MFPKKLMQAIKDTQLIEPSKAYGYSEARTEALDTLIQQAKIKHPYLFQAEPQFKFNERFKYAQSLIPNPNYITRLLK